MASRSVCFVCAHSLQIKISAEKKERYETEDSESPTTIFLVASMFPFVARTAEQRESEGKNGLNGMCQINGKEHKCFVLHFFSPSLSSSSR